MPSSRCSIGAGRSSRTWAGRGRRTSRLQRCGQSSRWCGESSLRQYGCLIWSHPDVNKGGQPAANAAHRFARLGMFRKQQSRSIYHLAMWFFILIAFDLMGKSAEVNKLFSDISDFFAILAPITVGVFILGILSVSGVSSGLPRGIFLEESSGTIYALFAVYTSSSAAILVKALSDKTQNYSSGWYFLFSTVFLCCLSVQLYIAPKLAAFLMTRGQTPHERTFVGKDGNQSPA